MENILVLCLITVTHKIVQKLKKWKIFLKITWNWAFIGWTLHKVLDFEITLHLPNLIGLLTVLSQTNEQPINGTQLYTQCWKKSLDPRKSQNSDKTLELDFDDEFE